MKGFILPNKIVCYTVFLRTGILIIKECKITKKNSHPEKNGIGLFHLKNKGGVVRRTFRILRVKNSGIMYLPGPPPPPYLNFRDAPPPGILIFCRPPLYFSNGIAHTQFFQTFQRKPRIVGL